MADKELFTLFGVMNTCGFQYRQQLLWVKSSFTLGHQDFQWSTEPAIYSMAEGSYDGLEEDGEGEIGMYYRGKNGKFHAPRKIHNVWFFDKPRSSKDHPTMKPLGLCAKGILCLSDAGDIVFDPFLGSGSTLIACEQTGRVCFGSEIDPKYMDVIRKRWVKQVYGDDADWQALTPAVNVG